MKAKEYIELYINTGFEERENVLVNIAKSFMEEINTLAKSRNAKCDAALIPICNELNQKWMKFAEIVNIKYFPNTQPIKYAGFKSMVNMYNPKLFAFWDSNKPIN